MYLDDIKKRTNENDNFRTVLHTGVYSQIVAMSILPGEDIGEEAHSDTDQILFIVSGKGEAIIDGETRSINKHDVIFVPAKAVHNFKNTDSEPLKLFTIYAPPEHPDGTIHKTKADAVKIEHS